jgi:hypothetical protein
MERTLVSKASLIEIINREMQKFPASQGCAVIGSIDMLSQPLPDGGNWSRSVAIGGRPKDPHACGEVAHDIIVKIAEFYNLEG